LAADSNFAFKIATKTADKNLVTMRVYRNLSSPYPTLPSPTSYSVRFSNNTCVTDDNDRQTDDDSWQQRTDDTSCQRLDL